jgi:lipopolysaccharide transport system permease protein
MDSNPNLGAVTAPIASTRRTQVIYPTRSPLDILVVGLESLVKSAGVLRGMTVRQLKIRYRHSLLGWFWALLQPVTLMALYAVIFSRLTSYSPEHLPYPLFLFSGLILWAFCSTSISTAAAGMLNHRRLMATVYFPREIVPLSFIAASLVDLAIALILLFLMMVYYSVPISRTAFLGFPILVLLTLLVTAVCLLVSSLQVRLRDISVALPMLLQLLMFTTPIVYPASAVPETVASLYWLNPFALLVENFRQTVVSGALPAAGDLLYCTLLAVICFVVSYLVFKKIEPTIVDEL